MWLQQKDQREAIAVLLKLLVIMHTLQVQLSSRSLELLAELLLDLVLFLWKPMPVVESILYLSKI